jgi:hypothetical protein
LGAATVESVCFFLRGFSTGAKADRTTGPGFRLQGTVPSDWGG